MNYNIKSRRYNQIFFKISTLITISWFCFMTYLSHQIGETTTELSKGIVEKIIEYFNLTNYNEIHYIIRKLAHPFVFSIFAVLVLFTLSLKWNSKKIYFFAIVLISLWTWLDEVTKLSIPGRHFSWEDTLLNLVGVIVGVIIFILFSYWKKNN